ncbi:MAG: proteasome ATPase, partial [Bowdeniella nasicola]|nr:proteasome ATPase [Bowdeniella nasicola]
AYGGVDAVIDHLISLAVTKLFATGVNEQLLSVTFADGSSHPMYFRDFVSGALVANIVDRVKKAAVKDYLDLGERGIRTSHMQAAIVQEMREHEDLRATTDPDEWARVLGRSGQRVVEVTPAERSDQ